MTTLTDRTPQRQASEPLASVLPAPTSIKSARMPLRRLSAVIVMVGIFVIGMTVYSYSTGLRLAERYAPLIDAAMEVKLEATTAHLWFEEIIANDRNEDYASVRQHLNNAKWYAQAMLDGGTNAEGTFIPLDDPKLRQHIEHVLVRLNAFSNLLDLRWRARLSAGPGTPYDQQFDAIFTELIQETDVVETRLQELTAHATNSFKSVHIVMGLLAIIATAFIATIFFRFAREQNQTLNDLQREIEQRMAAEKTLLRQATTDTLTGLLNRRSITDMLNQEVVRSARSDGTFSVILFDLDHFKSINDTHGHNTGDKVLKNVAECIGQRLRELDAFARWGGEEFLVLARETPLDGAMALAETCRARLAEADMGQAGHITASFGVAEHKSGEGLRELIHRADIALYTAKTLGRNTVMPASDAAQASKGLH